MTQWLPPTQLDPGYGVDPLAAARQRVQAPAIALMVYAILSLIGGVLGLVFNGLMAAGVIEIEQEPVDLPANMQWLQTALEMVQSPVVGLVTGVVSLVITTLVLIASIQMKSLKGHTLAVVGCILALQPCVNTCCLLGLPFGIWGLVVLLNADVKAAFAARAA